MSDEPIYQGEDFTVERKKSGVFVHLPHQCDSWDIAGEDPGWSDRGGVSKSEAVAALESFLADGAAALAALKASEAFVWIAPPEPEPAPLGYAVGDVVQFSVVTVGAGGKYEPILQSHTVTAEDVARGSIDWPTIQVPAP